MNYMLPDPTKQTSCKNCIFCIYDGKTQIGCEANRIENFGDLVIPAYDDIREFYVINRLCNMHRSPSWNDGVKDLNKAYEESCLSFDILIDCDDINQQYTDSIIKELNEINYPKNKYNIILFHSYKLDQEKRNLISSIYSKFKLTISMYFDKSEYMESLISKTKNAFHILLNQNNIHGFYKFMKDVDKLVNIDLKRFVLSKNDEKIAISNMACRTMYADLYHDYDKNIVIVEEDAKKENLYLEF